MLHWLAGKPAPDGANDPDATNYIEPPETPAPVFAVRAFKHAIFGTPQTVQPKPRRNSNAENSRPRSGNPETRAVRPSLPRPKSASDAQVLGRPDGGQAYAEPPASPTKSILLPAGGTPGGKKKNVTFGDHVMDNEEKRPLKSGLPDDCPGKFPSPGHKSAEEFVFEEDQGRGRGKLTEALEQVRDESRKRKSRGERRREFEEEDEDVPVEFREPKSESGKYWKREYETYRTNTQREVKKLLTKQKAAKSYAQSKDFQCTELADQLRQEHRKVEELGSKTAELSAQMKEVEEKLRLSQEAEQRQKEEIEGLKRQLGRTDGIRPASSEGSKNELAVRDPDQLRPDQYKRIGREAPKIGEDPIQRPSQPYKTSPQQEKPKMDIQTLRARLKSRQEPQPKPADDIWAQSFGSSSPVLTRSTEKHPPSPKASKPGTSMLDPTPLKTLDINSLPPTKDPTRTTSMEVECRSTTDLTRVDSKTSSGPQEKQKLDSPLQSPSLPLPSASELHSATSTAVKQEPAPHKDQADEDHCVQIPSSSPFQVHAKPLPPRPGNGPSGPRDAPKPPPHGKPGAWKENLPPSSSRSVGQVSEAREKSLAEKPSALWSSLNVPPAASGAAAAGRRNGGMTGKDGREVSGERLEAARARIAARKATG